MSESDRLALLDVETTLNAVIAWVLILVLASVLVNSFLRRDVDAIVFGGAAIAVITVAAVTYRNPRIMPPWYFVLLICLPVLVEAFDPLPVVTPIVPSIALATLGLLFAVDLHRFTKLRLVPWFAVVLTVLFTLAMAGVLNVVRWTADHVLGTSYFPDGRSQDAMNEAMMIEFVYVLIAGLVAGAIFYAYFRWRAGRPDTRVVDPTVIARPERDDVEGVLLSERLGVPVERQRQLARVMQGLLLVFFLYGVSSRELGIIVNAGIALVITLLPAILERDYQIVIEPGLVLWITVAVFLHALGTGGLYRLIGPWDHLTHTFSTTVVAAGGYATLRAIHLHGRSVYLPRWALFAFTIVFVLAFGVVWEILEFAIDQSALLFGFDPVLAQHGLDDTIMDLVFDAIGAFIVAMWGTIYLTEISSTLADQLELRLGT